MINKFDLMMRRLRLELFTNGGLINANADKEDNPVNDFCFN